MIEFRERLTDQWDQFKGWHYWGFINDSFTVPTYTNLIYSEQFTGIKDKNGAKLFHKDIFKAFDRVTVVEKHHGAFGYWPDIPWKFMPFAGHDHLPIDENGCCSEIEKIGNVHENPDLIPEVKSDGN